MINKAFSLCLRTKAKDTNRITKTFQRFDSLLNTMSYDIAAHYCLMHYMY